MSLPIPKLNKSGSLTIKLRYWSKTWAICSDVPLLTVWSANSSNSCRGTEDRKLMYAGEYRLRERSEVMSRRLSGVGSTRYTTGTSGIECLVVLIFLCKAHQPLFRKWYKRLVDGLQVYNTYKWMVTPHVRRSFTRRTLLITSLPKLSKTRTFHIGSPSELRIGVD